MPCTEMSPSLGGGVCKVTLKQVSSSSWKSPSLRVDTLGYLVRSEIWVGFAEIRVMGSGHIRAELIVAVVTTGHC